MTGAIVITWGASVPGREAKGLEVFGKALSYYEDLAKQGRIHGHREYFSLTGNLAKWGGMMIVDGELDELLKIQTEEPTLRLIADADAIVGNFTIQICAGGSDRAVQEQVNRYVGSLQDLGYM